MTGPIDRARGALLGLAVGDAVGTTAEFQTAGAFEPLTDIVGGGPFGLPPGAWTDDTSMALCLGESLLACGGFDPVDQLERYVRWWRHGHWSSTGDCFDIGVATQAALERFERTREPYPGDAQPRGAGNGPIMKLAPVPIAFAGDPNVAIAHAAESARTTHGDPRAVDAARYLSGLLVGALNGDPLLALLGRRSYAPPGADTWARAPLHPEVAEVADGSFRDRQPPEIAGKGFVVASLEAALWAVWTTHSFDDAVLAAANLGDDADTTAAVAGQLAGAVYGESGIRPSWLALLHRGDEIGAMAEQLSRLGAKA